MVTKTRIFNAILMFAGALLLWALFARLLHKDPPLSVVVVTPRGEIQVTVANTQETRTQGLSGTTSLTSNTGKLFIFDKPYTYGFWMKDMHYPIDIVWIDEAKKVVGITSNLSPDTYPESFYPPSAVLYVLELNAGDASVWQLVPGVHIDILKSSQK